jgi:hypothetical protein
MYFVCVYYYVYIMFLRVDMFFFGVVYVYV